MKNNSIDSIKLEKHLTKDIHDQHVNGSLTVIWRDWDKIIEDIPKMIYVTTVKPGEIKGPHLHLKRNSYFTCIRGKVVFVAKDKSGDYTKGANLKSEQIKVIEDALNTKIPVSEDVLEIIKIFQAYNFKNY